MFLINKNYLKIYSYTGLIFLWLSLGSNPNDIFYLFTDRNPFLQSNNFSYLIKLFVNFLRALFPLLFLIISIYIIQKLKFYKNIDNGYKIIFVILLAQFLSTIYSYNTEINSYETKSEFIGRFYWTISSLSLLLIFIIFDKIEKNKKKLLYISMFFILCIVIFFSTKYLLDFYSSNTNMYNLNFRRDSGYFLNHEIPRVTGLSRSIIVLFLFIIFFFIYKFSFHSLIKKFYLTILLSLIFLFQSKFGLLFLIISSGIYIYFQKEKFKTTVGFIILLTISLILAVSASYSKEILKIDFSKEKSILKEEDGKFDVDEKITHFRTFNMSTHYSKIDKSMIIILGGRHYLWISSLDFIKRQPILGYGSMSDRVMLNRNKDWTQQRNPVSNAFFYSLISGGILSGLILIYFYFYIFKILLINTFRKKYWSKENNFYYAIIVMIILRSLIENSFMLFGIDYILLLHALKIKS